MKKVFAFLLAALAALLSLTMPAKAEEDVLKRDLETVREIVDAIQAEYFTPRELVRVEVRLRVSDEGEESILVGPVFSQFADTSANSLFFQLLNQYVEESDITSEISRTYYRVDMWIPSLAEKGDVNMDGAIGLEDAMMVLQEYVDVAVSHLPHSLSEEQLQLARVHPEVKRTKSSDAQLLDDAWTILMYYTASITDSAVLEQDIDGWIADYWGLDLKYE